jgi:hypothetical protein
MHTHTVQNVLTESTGTYDCLLFRNSLCNHKIKSQIGLCLFRLQSHLYLPSASRACLPPKACRLQKASLACLKPVKASCRDGALDTFWCSWVGNYIHVRTYVRICCIFFCINSLLIYIFATQRLR